METGRGPDCARLCVAVGLGAVDDGRRVVRADDAFALLLHLARHRVWLGDVLGRHGLQLGHPARRHGASAAWGERSLSLSLSLSLRPQMWRTRYE